jgi:hypothetical protein
MWKFSSAIYSIFVILESLMSKPNEYGIMSPDINTLEKYYRNRYCNTYYIKHY